jgi:hypothetical protein
MKGTGRGPTVGVMAIGTGGAGTGRTLGGTVTGGAGQEGESERTTGPASGYLSGKECIAEGWGAGVSRD